MVKQCLWTRRTECKEISIIDLPRRSITVSTKIADASASRDYKGAYHSEGDHARREACPCAVFGAQSLQSTGTRHTGVGVGHQDYVLTSVKLGKNGFADYFDVPLKGSCRSWCAS